MRLAGFSTNVAVTTAATMVFEMKTVYTSSDYSSLSC